MDNHEQALKAIGVSRDAESPGGKSLLIAFNRKPTDDELRRVHDTLAALQPTEQPEAAQDERERFEYVERASNLKRDDEGDYENPCVQSAWEGWQAAKRDAAQAPQERAAVMRQSILHLADRHAVGCIDLNRDKVGCRDAVIAFALELLSLSAQSSEQKVAK